MWLITAHKGRIGYRTLGWHFISAIFVTTSLSSKWMTAESWKRRVPCLCRQKGRGTLMRGAHSTHSLGEGTLGKEAGKAVSGACGHRTKDRRGGLPGWTPEETAWWTENTCSSESIELGFGFFLPTCNNICHLLSTYCVLDFMLNLQLHWEIGNTNPLYPQGIWDSYRVCSLEFCNLRFHFLLCMMRITIPVPKAVGIKWTT